MLGISYPTLKQWIYKGKIRTVKTAGGHHRIPEQQIDKFLYRAAETGDIRERRSGFRRISGRNQLVGRITEIKVSGFMAQAGTILIGGNAAGSLGDSLYEAVIYVGGKIRSLGADAQVEELTSDDVRRVTELASAAGFSHIAAENVTRVASARNLYRFDALKDQRY